MEPVEPVLKIIYQSNTYRKDFSWPHFDGEPKVQEKQQVKQHFHVATRGTSPDVTKVFYVWAYSGFIETQSNLRRNKLLRTS